MKINGFHHAAIRVRDFDASMKFYVGGLGFKEKVRWGEGDGRVALVDCGNGNYVEIFANGKGAQQPESAWFHVAFRTDDCDAALERARAAGAVVTMESKNLDLKTSLGPATIRIAFCKGPDGEIIEFFQNELT